MTQQSIAHRLFRASGAMYLTLLMHRTNSYKTALHQLETGVGSEEELAEFKKLKENKELMKISIALGREKVVFESSLKQAREYFIDLLSWVHLISIEEKNERNVRAFIQRQRKRKAKTKWDRTKARPAYVTYKNASNRLERARHFAGMNCDLYLNAKKKVSKN